MNNEALDANGFALYKGNRVDTPRGSGTVLRSDRRLPIEVRLRDGSVGRFSSDEVELERRLAGGVKNPSAEVAGLLRELADAARVPLPHEVVERVAANPYVGEYTYNRLSEILGVVRSGGAPRSSRRDEVFEEMVRSIGNIMRMGWIDQVPGIAEFLEGVRGVVERYTESVDKVPKDYGRETAVQIGRLAQLLHIPVPQFLIADVIESNITDHAARHVAQNVDDLETAIVNQQRTLALSDIEGLRGFLSFIIGGAQFYVDAVRTIRRMLPNDNREGTAVGVGRGGEMLHEGNTVETPRGPATVVGREIDEVLVVDDEGREYAYPLRRVTFYRRNKAQGRRLGQIGDDVPLYEGDTVMTSHGPATLIGFDDGLYLVEDDEGRRYRLNQDIEFVSHNQEPEDVVRRIMKALNDVAALLHTAIGSDLEENVRTSKPDDFAAYLCERFADAFPAFMAGFTNEMDLANEARNTVAKLYDKIPGLRVWVEWLLDAAEGRGGTGEQWV